MQPKKLMDWMQALDLLKQGVCLRHAMQPILFIPRKSGQIAVHGLHYHIVVSPDDFGQLYEDVRFIIYEAPDEIDLEKDQAYYQWRFHHQ